MTRLPQDTPLGYTLGVKIQILSDIHLERHMDGGQEFFGLLEPEGIDVLVLAGDIARRHDHLSYALKGFCEYYPQVVYVFGNHELYGSSFKALRNALSKIKYENLHILDNQTCEINGQRFVGTTLWYSWPRRNTANWSDFTEIKDFKEYISDENIEAAAFLMRTVTGSDVVVTHTLPSWRSVHPRWAGHKENAFFVCDMESLIQEVQPKLWCHGHTHESLDYKIGQTRVVCNPFGYVDLELNPRFNELLTIEI